MPVCAYRDIYTLVLHVHHTQEAVGLRGKKTLSLLFSKVIEKVPELQRSSNDMMNQKQ